MSTYFISEIPLLPVLNGRILPYGLHDDSSSIISNSVKEQARSFQNQVMYNIYPVLLLEQAVSQVW